MLVCCWNGVRFKHITSTSNSDMFSHILSISENGVSVMILLISSLFQLIFSIYNGCFEISTNDQVWIFCTLCFIIFIFYFSSKLKGLLLYNFAISLDCISSIASDVHCRALSFHFHWGETTTTYQFHKKSYQSKLMRWFKILFSMHEHSL